MHQRVPASSGADGPRAGWGIQGVGNGAVDLVVQEQHEPRSQQCGAVPQTSVPKRNFLRRELGFISTAALTINTILGSGIFITPASILQHTGSFGLSVALWVAGALIAYAGSLCYLELALMVKKSGSTFIFIKEAYSFTRTKPWMKTCGSLMGFLMFWSDTIIAAGSAIPLLALGRYLCRPFFMECDACDIPIYAVKMFSLSALMILTIMNIYSVRLSAALLTWLSFFKILIIAFVMGLGTWKLIQQNGTFPEDSRHPFEGSNTNPGHIVLGLYGVIFAYDGWFAATSVQEESKGSRAVKWTTYVSVPVVGVLYVFTVVCFFAVLSYHQISSAKAVGLVFGEAVLGKAGVVIFCLLSFMMILGTANANVFTSSRTMFVASREGLLPRFISGVHVTYRTPLVPIVIQSFLTGVYVVIGDIDSLLNLFNAVDWFWYGCAFFGVIVMRLTRPNAERPYKVLLLIPCVMTVVSILLIVLPLWQDPVAQLIGLCIVLAGIPVYVFFVMEKPCKLRPKVMDRLSAWMTSVTCRLFNMEISGAFDPFAK